MKKLTMTVLIFCLLLCGGCAPQQKTDKPLCRVVTRIQIVREEGEASVSHCYTDDESMGAILTYLRKLRPYGLPSAVQPEAAESTYFITLDYSDGTQHSYRQMGNGFFQDSSGKWKQIDQELGKDLTLLFEELPAQQTL